ncbi:metallophosphoesterase [Pedococcus sp. P5_B7]
MSQRTRYAAATDQSTARAGTHASFGSLQRTTKAPPTVLGQTPDGTQSWVPIGSFAHVSDLHITDVESPARLDFVIDLADDPRYEQAVPVPRPQQLTSTHAAAATMATVDRLAAAGEVDFVVLTGDLVDNAQRNELTRLETMLTGGRVHPTHATGALEGVHTEDWSGAQVWQPHATDNLWATRYGFPTDETIPATVSEPFDVPPLRSTILLARGNHDALFAGTVAWTPRLASLAVGDQKVRGLPEQQGLLDDVASSFRSDPDSFFTGTTHAVTPDATRRPLRSDEFPVSIGATPIDRVGYDYLTQLTDNLFVIVLDTVDNDGHPDGVLSTEQGHWLDSTLTALETRHPAATTIIASHHGPRDHHVTSPDPNRLTGAQVVDILCMHLSVVLWATGHAHAASVERHLRPDQRGFWEVTGASIIDWPCQFSRIHIARSTTGAYRINVDKLDYDAQTLTGPGENPGTAPAAALADLHRDLAANQADFGRIFPSVTNYDVRDLELHLPGPDHPTTQLARWDLHVHSNHSWDTTEDVTVPAIVAAARDSALAGLAVTNHFDCAVPRGIKDLRETGDLQIPRVVGDILQTREHPPTDDLRPGPEAQLRPELLLGLEVGEPHLDPDEVYRLRETHQLDYVLGAVHSLEILDERRSVESLLRELPADTVLDLYWAEVGRAIDSEAPIDTIAHLGYPLRQLNLAELDLSPHGGLLTGLLSRAAARGVSVELNSRDPLIFTTDLLRLGLDVPGLTLCLGSDAHDTNRIGERLEHLAALLTDHGFSHCPGSPGRYGQRFTSNDH